MNKDKVSKNEKKYNILTFDNNKPHKKVDFYIYNDVYHDSLEYSNNMYPRVNIEPNYVQTMIKDKKRLHVILNINETKDSLINISFSNSMKNLYNLVRLFFEDIKATADKNTCRNTIEAIYNNLVSGNYPQWEGFENDIYAFDNFIFRDCGGNEDSMLCNAIILKPIIDEFFEDMAGGTLKKIISYKKSAFNAKYNTLVCFNFNGEKLIDLKGFQNKDICDYFYYTNKYYVLSQFLTIYNELRPYITTKNAQKAFFNRFKAYLCYSIITGYTGTVEYKLHGCKYIDLYNDIKNSYAKEKDIISHFKPNDNKKGFDIQIKSNDFLVKDYLDYAAHELTSNHRRILNKYKKETNTSAKIEIRQGSSIDKVLIKTTLTGGELIGRLFRCNVAPKPIPMLSLYDYNIPNMRDGFSYYLRCIFHKTIQKPSEHIPLSVFCEHIKKRKSERNVVLSTLTEYALARIPETEAKTLVKQAYGNRYKDANKLLETVAELRTSITSRTNEVGLFMQFINEIGRKYAW